MPHRAFVLFCVIFWVLQTQSTSTRGLTKVWIGYDENVLPVVLNNTVELFTRVHFTQTTTFLVNNSTQVASALADAEVVYLCPSTDNMLLSPLSISLLDQYVQTGGVLLYPAGFNDTRSWQVSEWFQKPLLRVNSSMFSYDIEQMYRGAPRGPGQLDPYYNPLVALPTNQSLFTAFGRISPEHQFGLPFQWFSDNLYWVKDNIHHMVITPQNRDFCMFHREGTYSYGYNTYLKKRDVTNGQYNEACWVFDFNHGMGHVVEISMAFETPDALSLQFVERFVGVVSAAVGLSQRSQSKFIPKPNDVLLQYRAEIPYYGGSKRDLHEGDSTRTLPAPTGYRNGQFGNVAYDLSLTNDVFVWRRTDRLQQLERLRALTGAPSFTLLDIGFPSQGGKRAGGPGGGGSGPFPAYYANMIANGDDLVGAELLLRLIITNSIEDIGRGCPWCFRLYHQLLFSTWRR